MEFRYLYIDDNTEVNAKGIITGLEFENELIIDFDNPKGVWEEERARILSDDFRKYDGLILDLNLEETPNLKHAISLYKGSTLAQEIRNLSKAGEIKEIPIILLSATNNLAKFFDQTNEDLFDLIIPRENLGKIYINTRKKLRSLSQGYKQIGECKKDHNFDKLLRINSETIDIRLLGEIKLIFEYPIHTISSFIIKNLLNKSGILIPEDILATRLGINREESKDWIQLLDYLENYKYAGVFSEGWDLWWMNGIENWWYEDLESKNSLRSTKANQKVEYIKNVTKLKNLIPIEKLTKSRSETFWTNCVGSGASIDTIDGLLIANQDNNFPWQDKRYISYNEALQPIGKTIWKKLSPPEEFKLEQLKRKYPNERPNK